MPRVHSATARKDYPSNNPNANIQKGEKYFYWSFYRQSKQRSKTYPLASQTESNPTKANLYRLEEAMASNVFQATTVEEVRDAVTDTIDNLDEVIEEFQEKANNIEEGFGQEMPICEELNQWAETVEEWKSELESVDLEPDEEDENFDLDNLKEEIPTFGGF